MQNKKVLVIDLDPQGNATTGLGLSNIDTKDTIYEVLIGSKEFKDVIKNTNVDNLNIVSSNVELAGLEVETAGDGNRAFFLKNKTKSFFRNKSKSIFLYFYRLSTFFKLINGDGHGSFTFVDSPSSNRVFCTRRPYSINENNWKNKSSTKFRPWY